MRWRSISVSIALVLASVLTFTLFGPTQVGGSATYVLTQGDSMLPTYRPGGLVMTRATGDYQVGDVVAYNNRQLGGVVLHRIVALGNGRYVMKGDNNDFLDSYRPRPSDVLGEEWAHVAGGAAYLRPLRDPRAFGFLVAALTVVALRPGRRPHRSRARHA